MFIYVYNMMHITLFFHHKCSGMRNYENQQFLICNQGVAGSNPAAGTNKNNYLDDTESTLSLFLVSPLVVI